MTTATPDRRVELTLRSLILGVLITLVFTAANVFLGLKVGLTFASSIPAAVISMAVLRMFSGATIWENNIVQTVASSAGTLSSIIFVLPGLVMIGWWSGFPFWTSFAVCAIGGILGVMYSIPLRRALVTNSDLPYPEGVAAAEVLKVGSGSRENATAAAAEGRSGLIVVVVSSLAAAGVAALTATRLMAVEFTKFFKVGAGAGAAGTSFSLALFGAGHLVGLSVGLAMLTGLVISWGVVTPILTSGLVSVGDIAEIAGGIWRTKVRFMGAGAIGVAAIWTLGRLAMPLWRGLMSALAAQAQRTAGHADALDITERDIPIGIVAGVSVAALLPLAWLFWTFLQAGGVGGVGAAVLIGGGLAYVVIVGFLVAAVCGYMAGLIGSSNSPLSGIGILAVIGASLLLVMARVALPSDTAPVLVAFALFATAVVFAVSTIANDNLQDLKTGQLVGATPWKQQAALVVGVIAGALVIPPILDLLNSAYGFAGGAVVRPDALPAPQATLISALAKGVLEGGLDWGLIGIGGLIGAAVVLVDEVLRKTTRFSLPPLAVGIGIYLPMSTTTPVVLGAISGWAYDRWARGRPHGEIIKRMGVLMASGLIVGESLFGVALAGVIVASGSQSPMALVGDAFEGPAILIGIAVFIAALAALYTFSAAQGKKAGA
ncbi:MAG: oligopeptide transporter, OPT family [Caulobacter sp.]|nr:oligopeptide transporter, OPT family [Caulobacter sp.]